MNVTNRIDFAVNHHECVHNFCIQDNVWILKIRFICIVGTDTLLSAFTVGVL